MTPQEAIKFLYFSKDYWEEASPVAEAHELAIKALERQIPKKPIDCGLHYECPYCNTLIIIKNKYCDICGQAIDWR